MKKLVFIIMIFMCSGQIQASDDWEKVPATEQYYKNELKKVYFHLGLGFQYGGVYYLNYKDSNNFSKFSVSLLLAQETRNYQVGFAFKISCLFEAEEYTDDRTYDAYREKEQPAFLLGAVTRFPLSLPLVESIMPYLMIGGGPVFINYTHIFMDEKRMTYFTELNGDGGHADLNFGVELELIRNLLYLDLGGYYTYNFSIRINTDDNSDDDEVKDQKEYEISYMAGFIFTLF
ncbi:MAG: hypothetical protein PHF84_00470 [bacterium]|nr:hypothetical protein [bacterium]